MKSVSQEDIPSLSDSLGYLLHYPISTETEYENEGQEDMWSDSEDDLPLCCRDNRMSLSQDGTSYVQSTFYNEANRISLSQDGTSYVRSTFYNEVNRLSLNQGGAIFVQSKFYNKGWGKSFPRAMRHTKLNIPRVVFQLSNTRLYFVKLNISRILYQLSNTFIFRESSYLQPSQYGDAESRFRNRESVLDTLKFVDSHCHLHWLFRKHKFSGTFERYREVFMHTFPKAFDGCLNVYCDPKDFKENSSWELMKEDKIWGAFGCHPHMVDGYNNETERLLLNALTSYKVVALGEIGLDYSSSNLDQRRKEIQCQVFGRQLKLAVERQLPLVIHSRDADVDSFKILKEMVPHNYLIHLHCFTGEWNVLENWLRYFPNLFIGLTNLVTFPSANQVHQVARNIPLNRLLLETDSPYFVPHDIEMPSNLKWSHPGMAIYVASKVASLRWQDTIEDVIVATRENNKKMYGF